MKLQPQVITIHQIKEIVVDFLLCWKEFALEEDENLNSDAQKVKKNLLRRTKVNGKYLSLPS